jgi:murein DD-endopeptidase MepM/ murein hydrolase activator NlpD
VSSLRRLAAALVAAVVVALSIGPGAASSKLEQQIRAQQARAQAIAAKLARKRHELHDAREKVGSIQAQLDETNHNIAVVGSHLTVLTGQMSWTQRKLDWNRKQLAAAERTLARHDEALRRRLVDVYEHGDLGFVDVLLDARSFTDFVERWNDIRFIIKANEQTIRERRSAAAHVHAIQVALLGEQTTLQNQSAQEVQAKNALAGLADQRHQLLEVADNQRRQVAQEVSQLDEESADAEAALEALIREKQREEEERLAAQRRARLLAGEPVAPISGAPSTLSWPLSGPITSPFGMRVNPVTRAFILHAGIDVGVPTGTTVTAAADGHVIIAQWDPGGCGNYIVIAHGGHLSTEYCHLSQFFVSVGQEVQRGQAIAASGATGNVTGPHLHFGVRVDGKPVDPMGYLK